MSHPHCTVASVRWTALCPWLILVRAARVSLMVRVIMLAVIGTVLTQAGWAIIERTTRSRADESPRLIPIGEFETGTRSTALPEFTPEGPIVVEYQFTGGPLVRGWGWAMQPFWRLANAESWGEWFAMLLAGAWTIAVWALFGGAIARIAAVYLTHGETIGPIAALRSAMAAWTAAAGAPVCALIAALIVALPLAVVGLMIRLNFLALLMGLLWFVVIIGCIALAVVLIGLALGWPLMWSTSAVERTDAFDGVSRAYAYVYQRPLHAFFFVAVAVVLGVLAQLAVDLFVDAASSAGRWAVGMGAGEDRLELLFDPTPIDRNDDLGRIGETGAQAMRFWIRGFALIAEAFPMAYLWPAAVGVYLLMRRQIDAADLGEIKFDEGDPQRGLPTLVNDPATGVPHVVQAPETIGPTSAP